jgi:hypothetical protein
VRTSFELKILASTLKEAKKTAIKEIATFLEIKEEDVLDSVNIELKVSYAEAKTRGEIAQEQDQLDGFVVTVFASVKQSVVKPFGL